jgi:hypothetical protein
LVFGIEGFEGSTPLVVPPLVEPAGHRPLQSVDLGFQSGVPCDLPLPPERRLLYLKAQSVPRCKHFLFLL